jgi:hypothetical protein
MKIPEESIKKIAEFLQIGNQFGNRCFLKRSTGEVIIYPFGADDDVSARYLEEDEAGILFISLELIEIEPMASNKAFQVMADFTDSVEKPDLKEALHQALSKNHPFGRFKDVIENETGYRQIWFEFRDKAYREYVRKYLEE